MYVEVAELDMEGMRKERQKFDNVVNIVKHRQDNGNQYEEVLTVEYEPKHDCNLVKQVFRSQYGVEVVHAEA
jgi:hypothetical protein